MIVEMKPLNLLEVKEMTKDLEEKKELKDYLKKFTKGAKKDNKKIIEELKKLDNLKLKEEHMIKIVDFMPQNSEELNKIFNDVSLDEKEANDILDIIKGA